MSGHGITVNWFSHAPGKMAKEVALLEVAVPNLGRDTGYPH
jgi:hypothetical protein